jgi:single-strand DNA-binding protein
MNINKFLLAGRVTKDIELRKTPAGLSVASVSVATNRTYTDKNTGQKVETTAYFNLTAFGKTAEIINQYFIKGQVIFAECRIENRNWEDKQGVKRYDYSFIIENFQFGAKPQGASQAPVAQTAPADDYSQPPVDDELPTINNNVQDINVEDILF